MISNSGIQSGTGSVIVNADDYGRDTLTTDRMVECLRAGLLSSVSAMVFMPDSERGAALAAEHGIDTGLHLNLTSPFRATYRPAGLNQRQAELTRFLRINRLSRILYHPGLKDTFRFVVQAQIDEYARIYGYPPRRLDGHHHMHLCSNILFSDLLPEGAIVRRSHSYMGGEAGWLTRAYRALVNRKLVRRHPTTDFFFNLRPFDPHRLQRIFARVAQGSVEVMTHILSDDEYHFLIDGGLTRCLGPIAVARGYCLTGGEPREAVDERR